MRHLKAAQPDSVSPSPSEVLPRAPANWSESINVQYLRLGEPPPSRPEKSWHVLVYGSGKEAYARLLRKD
jgi:hypothetical protein